MYSIIKSGSTSGINGYVVHVEVDISKSKRGLNVMIVGLPDIAVKESRERVLSAIKNSGFQIAEENYVINLAPANLRKEGSSFDLPIAVGILAVNGFIDFKDLKKHMFIGELSLTGRIKKIKGVLPIVDSARKKGIKNVFLPIQNKSEGEIITGINVYGIKTLKELIKFLKGEIEIKLNRNGSITFRENSYNVDYSEVKGQYYAKRAMEVAAAGRHNILMIGPPGSGKTMIARRLPTILPPLNYEESLETIKIYSISGLMKSGESLILNRPFRAPHHTISSAGLIGGGSIPKPGEVSLAHNGVLFLDELPEFNRNVLEVLRQPMEERYVTISRAATTLSFPANFMLVAAMNPCPCGYFGSEKCTCNLNRVRKYFGRISGPLMDRFDIQIKVSAVKYKDLRGENDAESSVKIRERVIIAREIQSFRFKSHKIFSNSEMTPSMIKEFCKLDDESEYLLKEAIEKLGFSARAYMRILKVSRTIADLEGKEKIERRHVAEAIQYRSLDREKAFIN